MAHPLLSAEQLKHVIADTLHHDNSVRKRAEDQLLAAKTVSGHPVEVLKLVATSDDSFAAVRQAAAVHFKNVIKKGWDVNREDGNEGIVISEEDRNTIKTHLVQLMCTTPPQIQLQLSESISLIAEVDYPHNWTNLLGELVQQFNTTDPAVLLGVLKTADSIFNRFCYVQRTDDLYRVIAYTLEGIQAPLLMLFKTMGQAVDAASTDAPKLRAHLEALCIMCRIYYSLNYQDLPAFFEDNMDDFMQEFAKYLSYQNPLVTDPDQETEPDVIDKLQTSIIDILYLYGSKDEEPFLPLLPKFLTLVWNLLMNVSPLPKQDLLATACMKFMTMLIEREMHRHIFQDDATLRQIVVNTVIPNLMFRESDEERFEDQPREYIITEVEGSHSESRRRCSQDLLKAITRKFETEITQICSGHVGSMLAEYSKDPNSNWAAKDAAIHLMMSIAIRAESQLGGVSEVNQTVDVIDFFQSHILPELQDSTPNRPVVKATALEFVSVFRNQFTKEQLIQLIPIVVAHLGSPVVVVHTFAAYAIERFLFAKEDVDPLNTGAPTTKTKIGSSDLQSFLSPLFTGLFAIVDNVGLDENDYVMKCVMRVLNTAGREVIAVTQIVIERLTAVLIRVAKNPRNPQFNHYVFESIAILIKNVCSHTAEATVGFESLLFEPFTTILQQDVAEFTPYVFQLLAQLLEFRPAGSGLGQAYTQLWPPLLKPDIWEKKGNVPALARLMQAYISKAATELSPQLNPVLGVFQKLLASKATETSAFEILNSAIIHFPQDCMASRISMIMQLLLRRLQEGKTPRYTVLVTNFFALFVGKYGAQAFFDCMDAMQKGLGTMLLNQVWIPRLKSDPPTQLIHAKMQVIGLTRLMCDSPALLTDENGQLAWCGALCAVVALLTSPVFGESVSVLDQKDFLEEEIGYDAKFSRLIYAAKPAEDPFPEVGSPVDSFVKSLNVLLTSSQHGQAVFPLIQHGLSGDPKLAMALQAMFQHVGVTMPS